LSRANLSTFEPFNRCDQRIASGFHDVIEGKEADVDRRRHAQEQSRPLYERKTCQISAVNAENVKRIKPRPLSPEEQVAEMAAPVGFQAADLAVQNNLVRPNGVHDPLRQLRPRLNT
jgi:hypothetical protein